MTHPIHSADSADTPEFLGRLIVWSMAPPGPEQETEYAGIIDYLDAWVARRAAAQVGAKGAADDPDEESSEDCWRRLALQFDGHRMQALGHLKMMVQDAAKHADAAAVFLRAGPLSGEAVLAERVAKIAAGAPAETPKPDADLNRVMALRDAYHDIADSLAEAIAAYFGVDIGEHSRDNRPWLNALNSIKDQPTPAATIGAGEGKDAALLDWLDSTNARFRMGWQVGCAPAGNLSVKTIITGGTTIREAIDAAMRSKTSPGEAG